MTQRKQEHLTKLNCSVVNTQTYRSTTRVNKTNDMVRVTLDMTINEWQRVKDIIGQQNNLEGEQ